MLHCKNKQTCLALFCQARQITRQLSGVLSPLPASPHLTVFLFFCWSFARICVDLFRLCASYFGTLNALSIFLVLGIGELGGHIDVLVTTAESRTALLLAPSTF